MWVYNSKNQTLTGKLEIRSKNVKESISQLRKKKKKKKNKRSGESESHPWKKRSGENSRTVQTPDHQY